MLKLNKDQMRLPFGGHHYYENGLMLRGESFEEVKQKLSYFRLNNNRPIGRPDQDILEYYERNFPWMVKKSYSEDEEVNPLFFAWRAWVQKTWARPPKKLVVVKEATNRTEICKICPHNVQDYDDGPMEEVDQLKRKTFMIRRGAKVSQSIGFCDLHRADISVLSFLETPKEHSEKKKDTPNYPGCWV